MRSMQFELTGRRGSCGREASTRSSIKGEIYRKRVTDQEILGHVTTGQEESLVLAPMVHENALGKKEGLRGNDCHTK